MNKWDIEEVFLNETKEKLISFWKEKTKEDFENEEEQEDYINTDLGNSFLEIIKELD